MKSKWEDKSDRPAPLMVISRSEPEIDTEEETIDGIMAILSIFLLIVINFTIVLWGS